MENSTSSVTKNCNSVPVVHYKSTSQNSESSTTSQHEDGESDKNKKSNNFASMVAAHYNAIESNTYIRNQSRIYFLRNFNNWVKSILIRETVFSLQNVNYGSLKVLDMCCGKGGDLQKWQRANLRYLICTDIAKISLEECEKRFKDFRSNFYRKNPNMGCEFIEADCTRVLLKTKYKDPSIQLDIVSCQFSFHYCFESLPQAECMLRNASDCLKVGGYFIGTIPNAYEIVKRIKLSKENTFENNICKIEMCCTEPYPLFGAKYQFYLEGVVNCPEFLVHFPTFKRLAKKYNLELVKAERFPDFFHKRKNNYDSRFLLKKINALETYTPSSNKLLGPTSDYEQARVFCEKENVERVGTLSKSEWEVILLYQTFVFKKINPESEHQNNSKT